MDNIENYMAQIKKHNETAQYKLYECFACGNQYSWPYTLELHLRREHKDLFEPVMCFHDNANTVGVSLPKPPLGLTPRFVTDEHRFSDIIEAMKRFRQAKQSIPDSWIDEMIEILDRREKKDG